MKLGALAILVSLLLAPQALAGTPCGICCGVPDADDDGLCDPIDNCSSVFNPSQYDGDQDGYGDACDCDFAEPNNNFCDGTDFNAFAGVFNTATPPTNCKFDMAQPPNGFVDGTDFNTFTGVFNTVPGPACGNAPGTPCATPGVPCP